MRTIASTALLLALPACASEALDPHGEPAARTSSALTMTSSELLGRPTDHSVTVKAIFDMAVEAYVELGTSSGSYSGSTSAATFPGGFVEVLADGLATNTLYYYRLRYRQSGGPGEFSAGSEHTFRTQRAAASTFTFDIQGDSHQGFAPFYSSSLYDVTMHNIANDKPDFLFDLGDTVSTDDATETTASVSQKYTAQRNVFSIASHSAPVFLVLGNHENEEGWNLDDMGTSIENSLPVLGANGRKRYFANPVPDSFYTGNGDTLAQIEGDHLRGDYYAFQWGSALFVAIDPFWYTTRKPYAGGTGGEKQDEVVGERWDWTLGKTQYDWLKQTLSTSTAPFKFVFAHHPTGGTTDYIRAGVLGSKYCEWGGYDIDGTTYSFDTKRPGWGMPVRDVLSENGVTAFFHGHDHVFAMEELNGVVYQELPHAANPDYGTGFMTNATDYAGAVIVNNSGHLRVTVSPTLVTVDYVRAFLSGGGTNGAVAYSYTISPCKAAHSDGKACDDGNACTTLDTCNAGACQPGTAVSCDDDNVCSDDSCNPSTGCVHANNSAPCTDDDSCTTGDVCSGGACVTVPVACPASDECHAAGLCTNGAGCSNPTATDGSPCSGGQCLAGVCSPSSGSGGAGGEAGVAGNPGPEGGEGGEGHAHGGSQAVGGSPSTGGTGAHGGSHARGGSHSVGGSSGPGDAGETNAPGESGAANARGGTHGSAGSAHGGTKSSSGGTNAGNGGEPDDVRGGSGGLAGSTTAGHGGTTRGRDLGPIGTRSGCDCRVADGGARSSGGWAALGLGLAFVRRRRPRRSLGAAHSK
ncbi:MAG TPA: metallophosphoesterase [Polyangiaceae bacterium]|nr:metallophosphoesterase [Polyangiaceae bacterium]